MGGGGFFGLEFRKHEGIFRYGLPEGKYRFANQVRTVIVHLITKKKGIQSTRGSYVNAVRVRLII